MAQYGFDPLPVADDYNSWTTNDYDTTLLSEVIDGHQLQIDNHQSPFVDKSQPSLPSLLTLKPSPSLQSIYELLFGTPSQSTPESSSLPSKLTPASTSTTISLPVTRSQKRKQQSESTFIPDIKPASGNDCISVADDSNFVVDDSTVIYEDDVSAIYEDDALSTDNSDNESDYEPTHSKKRRTSISIKKSCYKHKNYSHVKIPGTTYYTENIKVNIPVTDLYPSHIIRIIRCHGSLQKAYCHCADLLIPLLSGNRGNVYREVKDYTIPSQIFKMNVPSGRRIKCGQQAYVFTVDGLKALMLNNRLNQPEYSTYKQWITDNILIPLDTFETTDLKANPSILTKIISTASYSITY
jgi:hypothetical protein